MEIKDLGGLAEPLKKLVEVVAQGVGGFSKSYLIRKNADAKAYEIKQLADANKYKLEQEAETIREVRQLLGNVEYVKGKLTITDPSDQVQLSLPERIEDRKKYQEAKEQQNIEDITSIAAEELANEETVSSDPVADDWIARFFDAARLISDEQMQALWGKILAGEIKKPHAYSLRTLDLLRNLSKEEAEIFVKVAKLAIQDENSGYMLFFQQDKYWEENFNISFGNWLLLDELGLVNPQGIVLTVLASEETNIIFRFGDMAIVLENPNLHAQLRVKVFTTIGSQLARLVAKESNKKYLLEIAIWLKQYGSAVKYGKIIGISPEGLITHGDLQEFDFNTDDSQEQ